VFVYLATVQGFAESWVSGVDQLDAAVAGDREVSSLYPNPKTANL